MPPSNIYYIHDALTWQPGFFCTYQSVVGFLNFCEKEKPAGFRVSLEMGLYFEESVGPNWWEYYFEPINTSEPTKEMKIEHVGDMLKSHWNTEAISTMTRERASEIITKYIKLNKIMKDKVDLFCHYHINNRYVIGIHYRGCDKSSEAPRVPFDSVRDEVLKVLNNRLDYTIFVATDEQGFLNYMIKQFGNRVIYTNSIRSFDQEPIHHNSGHPIQNYSRYTLGENAVMDCYLLSKTNVMIRTQSNLSSSAANINPTLRVIDLNHAHYRKGLR